MWTIIVVYINLFKMKKIIVSSYFYLELGHRHNEE